MLNNQEVKLINELVEPFVLSKMSNLLITTGVINRGVVITMRDEKNMLRRIKVEMLTDSEPEPE